MSAVNVPSTRAVEAARTHSKVEAVTSIAVHAATEPRVPLAIPPTASTVNVGACFRKTERGTKTGATGADDQHIMFMGFVIWGHRIRMSLKTPEASIRM